MSSKPTAETRRTVQRRDRYRCAMCDRETTIPVYYRTGGWQQLNKDGTRHPCPPPEDLPTHIDIKKGDQ